MNAWYNGYADPATMIKDGYQLISIPDGLVYIVPKAGYYYDYLNEPYLYKEWTPAHIGKAVFDEKHPSILGGMFAIWNDHVGNGISVKDIHHRIFSPLQTLSVKMWTGAQTDIPYETFNEKRASSAKRPESTNWQESAKAGIGIRTFHSRSRQHFRLSGNWL